MNGIWLSLLIYAVVEAIAAAYRVRQKRRTDSLTQSSDSRFSSSSRSLVQPTSTAALQLDSDLDRLFYPSSNQSPSEPLTLQTPPPELGLPLAASLSVSELVHPETRANSTELFDLNLGGSDAPMDVETVKPHSPEHQSVLAEISQLDHADSENVIAAFRHHLNHPDDIIRAAIVFEFGEAAAKYQGAKAAEAREILMQLSQDPNPNIRTQAMIALAKIDPIVL